MTPSVGSPDLHTRLRRLHTALLCDALDQLGHRNVHVGSSVRALAPGMVVAGTAFPMRSIPVDAFPERPYAVLLEAYRTMRGGDVVVLTSSGESTSAIWGELLSTAATARGVTGVVLDGLTRDVDQIVAMQFPTFCSGVSPLDSAGRQEVVAYGEPITCGRVRVRRGDVVFGDAMGVIVIPAEVADEAVRLAEEKDRGESTARVELAGGDDVEEVFARHGIL